MDDRVSAQLTMTREGWLWLAVGGGAVLWALSQSSAVTSAVESGADDVQAAIAGWKTVQNGPTWVPVLNQAESQYGIPPDLLARMAYQESHFRQDVIDGSTASSAGALGLMQLEPQFFSTVNVPRPFTPSDTVAQIQQAAQQLQGLYGHFIDWGLAVAAYNDGQGNVDAYVAGTRALPAETIDYVSAVLADVPLNSATVPV